MKTKGASFAILWIAMQMTAVQAQSIKIDMSVTPSAAAKSRPSADPAEFDFPEPAAADAVMADGAGGTDGEFLFGRYVAVSGFENIPVTVTVATVQRSRTTPFKVATAYINDGTSNIRKAVRFTGSRLFPLRSNGRLVRETVNALPFVTAYLVLSVAAVKQRPAAEASGTAIITIEYH